MSQSFRQDPQPRGQESAAPSPASAASGEENAKGRIRHVMDFKHPRRLVLLAGAAVCVIVGILLLTNPGERGDQLEGVQMTTIRVLDQGVPVDLPEDLGHDVVPLIRQYDTGDYNDLLSYRLAAGDVILSDPGGGTVFYLTKSLDRELVLVRNNHDGYSWTSARKGVTLTGLKDDPDYRVWAKQAEDYLTTGRADELYALRTPYIGNHVADGNILRVLNVSGVAGPYTMELHTDGEPYGITLHLENFPSLESDQARDAGYLYQVGILFVALVDNASFFHWDYVSRQDDGTIENLAGSGVQPGLDKPVDRAAFQTLYDRYRLALGELYGTAAGQTARYSLGEALYLSKDMPWRDMPMYLGNVTVSKDLFSVQLSHALSSAWPQAEECVDPEYQRGGVPDTIPTGDGDTIDLTGFGSRELILIRTAAGADTGFRLYRLDGELWLSRETGGRLDWVFRLTDQTGLPPLPNETEE